MRGHRPSSDLLQPAVQRQRPGRTDLIGGDHQIGAGGDEYPVLQLGRQAVQWRLLCDANDQHPGPRLQRR